MVSILRGILTVELPDIPGQLMKVLIPLAESGCNIVNIRHIRENIREGKAQVEITFETENKLSVERAVEQIRNKGIIVIQFSPELETYRSVVILIGHVFMTDITDTIMKIMKNKVSVSEVDARITEIEEYSSVKMILQSNSKNELEKAMKAVKEICKQKNLYLIRS